MDSREFLGVVQTHDPNRWEIEVVPRLQTHGGFLWGGAGLASSVYAMEQMSGRQLVWATAQFLSHARPPEVMSIDVDLSVVGRTVTQARTVGHVAHKEILTVNAALGERNFAHSGQFVAMPEVPQPESITPWPPDRDNKNTISDRLDLRFVKGRRMTDRNGVMDDGRTIMWAKVRDVVTGVDSASLAVLADFVPMGLGMNMGINGGGTSIDNTIRIYKLAPTEWVLLDVHSHGVARGFGHGIVHMFAEDGTLLATASQSVLMRTWDDSK
jgi:acyl-CoA thioesterase